MWQLLPAQLQATRGFASSGAHGAFWLHGSIERFTLLLNFQESIILLRAATDQQKQWLETLIEN